jgi:predicted nucleic acid-binding protein
MSWVIDTCLIIDVLENDPSFGEPSARLIDRLSKDGLTLCPVSYVELAPAFLGDRKRQNEFLSAIGLSYDEPWDWPATQLAHQAWHRQVAFRRENKTARRPVADVLIGAFAAVRTGLLTRNPDDFKRIFPALTVKTPA